MNDCLFCKIIRGDLPSFPIWQDKNFLAILDLYPSTLGQTLVIGKTHHSSYFANLDDSYLKDLIIATKKVANLLDLVIPNISRTCLVFEGFDVDHIHAKLYPIHINNNLNQTINTKPTKATHKSLKRLQQKIKIGNSKLKIVN